MTDKSRRNAKAPPSAATRKLFDAIDDALAAKAAFFELFRPNPKRGTRADEADHVRHAKRMASIASKASKAIADGACPDENHLHGRPGLDASALIAMLAESLPEMALALIPASDLSLTCRSGMGALHWAAYQDLPEVVRALCDRDPSLIERRDPQGRSALHLCARMDALGCAQILMERGADPDRADLHGRTALMHACSMGYERIADFLAARCDTAAKDARGRIAVDMPLSELIGVEPEEKTAFSTQLERRLMESSAPVSLAQPSAPARRL